MSASNLQASLWSTLGQAIGARGSFLSAPSNPFYVVVPRQSAHSGEATKLFALCHFLNLIGERAFVIPHPLATMSDSAWPHFAQFALSPVEPEGLWAPLLTPELVTSHFRRQLTPICVYPESVEDPLKAPYVARFVLGLPSSNAQRHRIPRHFTVCADHYLAEIAGSSHILQLPTVDLRNLNRSRAPRTGSCFYVGSQRQANGKPPAGLPKGCREVLDADRMSGSERLELLATSKLMYCFEDTPLAVEACCSGCAVVYVPNDHLVRETQLAREFGPAGHAWGTAQADVQRALRTVGKVRGAVTRCLEQLPTNVHDFATATKAEAGLVPYDTPVSLPYDCRRIFVSPGTLPGPHHAL